MPNKTVISNFNAIEENDTLTYDTCSISKIFKNFFSNLAKSLLINLQSLIRYYSSFMVSDDFCLSNTSEEKVLKIITNIESSKAAGLDKLSSSFLRDDANILAKPISKLCNLSISQGVFPNSRKVAKLKPIFKKNKKMDPSNYRPISLLPSISKIIERVIHDQTNAFLSGEDILYNYQSGFRGNHSTNLCLSFLTDKVLKGFDKSMLTGMILTDLQKAFGTIEHEILLQKLKAIKLSESTIKWFKSYLSERIFLVNIENKLSNFGKISCGVPQGSILGPLLFLIYVNDMPQAITSALLLYPGDSCILYQHKDVVQIEKRLNEDTLNLCDWFVDNKLSIHFGEDKTKSILFASKRRAKNICQLNIKYKNINIKQHSEVTYLGCVLDETMSGEPMALKVVNKINSELKFLYRKNRFLSPELQRMLCNVLIQPHFDYSCPAWYTNLTEKTKKKIRIMQNKCIRLCLRLDKMHHISDKDFRLINWLSTSKRVDRCINTITFKFFNNTCPYYLKEIFEFAPHCKIGTRNKFAKLKILFRKTNMGQKAISFVGPSLWNNLPELIKKTDNLNTFKHSVKNYCLN